MVIRVHRSRRIENSERSLHAVEGVKLGQDPTAAGLNPSELERALVLRAQSECKSEEKEQLAHIDWPSSHKVARDGGYAFYLIVASVQREAVLGETAGLDCGLTV